MDRTNPNTALASALVEELARCGMRHAVLSPGSRSAPLAIALWRHAAIEVSVIVDERSAGYHALGTAQATQRPVAVLCTSGTAAANLHPAVAEADESGIALLVLTADRPPELRGIGAGQTIDQLKLYGSAVRWFCEVGTHDADDEGLLHFRSLACRAYARARGEPRPGPVQLNFPWREPLVPRPMPDQITASSRLALEGRGERPLIAVAEGVSRPEAALLDELAERLAATPRGLILAGRQTRTALREPIARLAAALGYPVLAEPTSQLRCGPHDRGLIASSYDAIARLRPPQLAPELVLRFGDMPTSKTLRSWISELGVRQVVIDPLYGWNEPTKLAELVVRADPLPSALGLAERLTETPSGAWTEHWMRADRAIGEAIGTELRASPEMTEPALFGALPGCLGDGELIYTGSSMPIRDQESFLPSSETDLHFLCNRGANGIDGLISSGIGAAHGSRRPTTILSGDLGLLHDIGGLAALRDLQTPLRIVVLNNDGGGIFHLLPAAEHLPPEEFEALMGTPRGLDLARAAALFDIEHRRVEEPSALPEALSMQRALVEVPVSRDRRQTLQAQLHGAAETALSSVP